jgi:hypothetical protein
MKMRAGWTVSVVSLVSACAGHFGDAPAPPPAASPRAPAPRPAPAPAPPSALRGVPAASPSHPGVPFVPLHPNNAAYATHFPGQILVIPPSKDPLNVSALLRIPARRCGQQQVVPGVWVRIDCHPYKPLLMSTKKLAGPHKMRLLSRGLLHLTPASLKTPPGMKTGAGTPGGSGGVTTGTAGDATFPDVVDHRQDGTEGPVKNQGAVGSCTAFSLSTVMDNAILRLNKHDVMSPLHLWSHYAYPSMGVAGDSNLNKSITTLSTWAYSPREACELSKDPEDDCGAAYGVTPGMAPGDSKLQGEQSHAEASGLYKIASIDQLPTQPVDVNHLVAVLASGQDLWIAMDINIDNWGNGLVNNVIPDWATGDGGHAIALAGYRQAPNGGRQFLIHNSWGATWGDQGFAWVSEAMVKQHMYFAYTVKVVDPNAPQPAQTDDDCDDSSLVDAGTGQCAPMCWDDTRRTNGLCATPNPNGSDSGQSTGAHSPNNPPKSPPASNPRAPRH